MSIKPCKALSSPHHHIITTSSPQQQLFPESSLQGLRDILDVDTCQRKDTPSNTGQQFIETLDSKSPNDSMKTDYEYLTILHAMKTDGD